jgi:anti-sigma B factor antagonist
VRFKEEMIGTILVAKVLDSRIAADVSASFRRKLEEMISGGNQAIVLDLSNVSFIDSSGLGALIACLKGIDKEGDLVLCGTQDTVESMFRLTRMNKVFRMFGNVDDAVAALS